MKSRLLFLFILLTLSLPSYASWDNITDSLAGSHLTVKSQNASKVYLELIPSKPLNLEFPKKSSYRWKITSMAKGNFFIKNGTTVIDSKIIAKGDNDFKIFLEPGKYQIHSTIGARAECFIWKKKRKLASLVPEGGGFATYMHTGDNNFAYYRVTTDTVPVLSVKGPTIAYVFFRANMVKGIEKTKVDLTVKENDSIVAHKISEITKSLKAMPSDDSTLLISEALVVHFKVPEGMHKYSIHVLNCKGYLKFYKVDKKSKKNSEGQLEQQGQLDDNDELDDELAANDLLEDEGLKLGLESTKAFRFTFHGGLQYDNNAYRYSKGFLDTFDLNLKSRRYPNVQKTWDIIFPLGAQVSLQRGNLSVGASANGNLYSANANLSNMGMNLFMTWSGPLRLRAQYHWTPYDPVRPTFDNASNLYKFMWYSEHKGTLATQITSWKIKPSLDFSYGYYNYNSIFNNYDAPFWESGISATMNQIIAIQIRGNIGKVTTKHNTTQDATNLFLGAEGEVHYDFNTWLIGVRGSILNRGYDTKDILDTHHQRKDLSGDEFFYVKKNLHRWAIASKIGYLWRATQSPRANIDADKDYGAFVIGIDFSWGMKV